MTPPRKQIVHVISKFSRDCWGGAETALLNVCPRLAEHGFDCEVWSPMVFSGTRQEVMDGVMVRRFPGFYLGSHEEKLAGRGKAQISPSLLWAALTRRDINLIHLHCHNRLSSFATLCGLLRGRPVVITVHYGYRIMPPRWRYCFPVEFAVRNADKVISVSHQLRDAVQRVHPRLPPEKFCCIPNGTVITPPGRRNAGEFRQRWRLTGVPLILNVGRICPQKNQALLVKILPEVLRHVPAAHLALIGPPAEDAYYQKLVTQIESSSCRPRIHLIPGLPPDSEELQNAYAAADVFVLPSFEEGLPLVILEAWSAGKPVIASNVPGNSELIEHGQNGLLFNLERAERELPQLIVELLGSPDQRLALGDAGRKAVLAGYTWDTIAAQLATTYDNVLQRRNRTG